MAIQHGGRHTLLRVARIEQDRSGRAPVVATLKWSASFLPPFWSLRWIPDPSIAVVKSVQRDGRRTKQWPAGSLVTLAPGRSGDFADAGFELIGKVPRRRGDEQMHWTQLCQWPVAADMIKNGDWFTPRTMNQL